MYKTAPLWAPKHSSAKLFFPVKYTPRTSLCAKNSKNLCTYPSEIEYANTDPMQVRREKSQNLCTYPLGIEYASIIEEVEIEIETKVAQGKSLTKTGSNRDGE